MKHTFYFSVFFTLRLNNVYSYTKDDETGIHSSYGLGVTRKIHSKTPTWKGKEALPFPKVLSMSKEPFELDLFDWGLDIQCSLIVLQSFSFSMRVFIFSRRNLNM